MRYAGWTFRLALVAAGLALAGCNDPFASISGTSDQAAAARTFALADDRGNTPPAGDALALAKKQFRDRNFGLAEQQFRAIVERESGNAEAWLGLAAAYDQLRRFDLADRAYSQVAKLNGESVALANNRGYSYLMRGDRARARGEFLKAQRLDPDNAFVANNLKLLSSRG